MFETMRNPKARVAERLEAARWLADRGFNQPYERLLDQDLEALLAIFEKYEPNVAEIAESGELAPSTPTRSVLGAQRDSLR
jgi:hypothetical protein